MTLEQLKEKLTSNASQIDFQEVIALIDSVYSFTPVKFANGNLVNEKGQNNGSCKLFSFAQLQGFSKEETLHCFGEYYRVDVLENPEENDHQNIRNFMKFGWEGIDFTANALELK